MHTCDICDTPLEREQDETITWMGDYRVCSYTCETVVYDRLFPSNGHDQRRFTTQSVSPIHE